MLDVTGTGKLFCSACDVAATEQQEVLSRSALDGVTGVGSNKLVAQTASIKRRKGLKLSPTTLTIVADVSGPTDNGFKQHKTTLTLESALNILRC